MAFYILDRPRGEVSSSDNGYGEDVDFDDHEEEFYYTEIELEEAYSPPTLSHRDMARPPHEGKISRELSNPLFKSIVELLHSTREWARLSRRRSYFSPPRIWRGGDFYFEPKLPISGP